jgi:CxxC-x17-CxxC domain-containing protein
MFPQVILLSEVKELKKYFNEIKTKNMHFGVMVETPAAVQIIEDICLEGIDFISFGTNDLTQFTLAIDRGEEDVQYLYNELDPSVLSQIKKVIEVCKRSQVETSICGQAGSNQKMVEILFSYGIDSISLNADAAFDISSLIKRLEENKGDKTNEESEEGLKENTGFSGGIKKIVSSFLGKSDRTVNCISCGKETKLPFKPSKNKGYYCKTCYRNNKNQSQPSQPLKYNEEPIRDEDKIKENNSKGLLRKENIKISAEEAIEPIENLERIEERSKEIHQGVEEENMKRIIEEDEGVENSIKVTGGPVDEESNEDSIIK